MSKKKVLVFTGAGVSAESGVETFRDSGGLWHNYKIEEVATPEGWSKNREKVLDFYNQRRAQLLEVEPNLAHNIIAQLEDDFHVTVVTQNVDNLHERAGSTEVVHLHGELIKSRSTLNPSLIYLQVGDIKLGDKCEKGSQLRPHIVWFGEGLDASLIDRACIVAEEADACIIVGTSMQVFPASSIPFYTKDNCYIRYVDPGKQDFVIEAGRQPYFKHVKMGASLGMQEVRKELLKLFSRGGLPHFC